MPRNRHALVDAAGETIGDLSPPPTKITEFLFQWRNWIYLLWEYLGVINEGYLSDTFIAANSLNVVSGGTPVGSIADIHSLLDGNVYQLPEIAGTPGFDLELNFTGVKSIKGIVTMTRYVGTATHIVTQRLYNYVDAQEDAFIQIPHSATVYQYRTILIPDGSKYIDANGNAKITFVHETSGNPSHDFYVDYVALIGSSL